MGHFYKYLSTKFSQIFTTNYLINATFFGLNCLLPTYCTIFPIFTPCAAVCWHYEVHLVCTTYTIQVVVMLVSVTISVPWTQITRSLNHWHFCINLKKKKNSTQWWKTRVNFKSLVFSYMNVPKIKLGTFHSEIFLKTWKTLIWVHIFSLVKIDYITQFNHFSSKFHCIK